MINANREGNYSSFNSGVIVGNVGSNLRRPIIGDYVGFGPGSMAFGNIHIGNNVFVAPNAIVTKDVEPNKVESGVPAKMLKERTLNDNLLYRKFQERITSLES